MQVFIRLSSTMMAVVGVAETYGNSYVGSDGPNSLVNFININNSPHESLPKGFFENKCGEDKHND